MSIIRAQNKRMKLFLGLIENDSNCFHTQRTHMMMPFLKIAFFGALLVQSPVDPADVESLKAAHNDVVEAVESSNLEALAQRIHPSAIGFFRESQFPVKLGMQYDVRKALPDILGSLSDLISANPATEYQAFGGTGVVCENYEAQEIVKKKQVTVSRRSTYAYSRLGGRWYLVSWHDSTVVPGK